MLGFAALSQVPLSSLPTAGGLAVAAIGPTANFGTPNAAYARTQSATGITPTTQLPSPRGLKGLPVTGFGSTAFGTGTGTKQQRPTGFLAGVLGTPRIFPFNTVGFRSTQFGTGRLFPYHVAPGIHSTQFGTPRAIWAQFGSASGFCSTAFGAPTHRRSQPVSGFASTNFGTPTGYKLQRAVGFCSTAFGAPRLFPFHVAPGIHSTQFGPINGWQHWDEVWNPPATRFGTPTTPTNRTAQAAGFQSTRYGQPGKVSHKPDSESWLCIASGFGLVRISSPVATWPQSGSASGIAAGHLGTPKGIRGQRATGIHSMAVGTPSVKTLLKASGFASGHLGLAAAVMTQRAAGAQFVQRFGLPESDRGHSFKVYGINASGRIGNPTGFSRFNYRVTGFRPVSIGSASCHESHRAIHVEPICRLGTPILKRNTQC